jgi:hypothetical protein
MIEDNLQGLMNFLCLFTKDCRRYLSATVLWITDDQISQNLSLYLHHVPESDILSRSSDNIELRKKNPGIVDYKRWILKVRQKFGRF